MKEFDWEGMIIDNILDEITPQDKTLLEAEMKRSPHLLAKHAEMKMLLDGVGDLPLHDAPESLTLSVEKMITDASRRNAPVRRINWWQAVAAIGLLLIGIASILRVNSGPSAEILAMQEELDQTKELMMTMINESSTSKRIKGINVSYTVDKPDQELLDALTDKLRNDKSNNVRLAAIEALVQFRDAPGVKQTLIRALEEESDEIVQIELIYALVHMKEKSAIQTMEKLLEKESTSSEVKDELHMGILKMT